MNLLAYRTLFRERVRLVVTLAGIAFAVVLVMLQLGLFLGFSATTSALIDHAGADLWIAARGATNFDAAPLLSDRMLYRVLATPGIAVADRLIVTSSSWKRPDGATESVEVVGFNPVSGLGGPWALVQGSTEHLRRPDTVIVDDTYCQELGVSKPGQVVELNGHQAHLAGFTHGIRSFTMCPLVFTSFKNALDYGSLKSGQTVYLLARVSSGAHSSVIRDRLAARLSHATVYTRHQFSRQTRSFWMFTTGAGLALLAACALAVVVGTVIVAQTIYTTTLEHLREYGTLKAIGATNAYLYKLLLKQAALSAVLGYLLGLGGSLLGAGLARRYNTSVLLPPELLIGMFGLTLGMCAAAALSSIHKVTRLEPVMVFRS